MPIMAVIPCGLMLMARVVGSVPVAKEDAGTVEGWVNGAELVFRAKSSTGDLDSYFMHLLNLDSLSLS